MTSEEICQKRKRSRQDGFCAVADMPRWRVAHPVHPAGLSGIAVQGRNSGSPVAEGKKMCTAPNVLCMRPVHGRGRMG